MKIQVTCRYSYYIYAFLVKKVDFYLYEEIFEVVCDSRCPVHKIF